MEGGQNSAQAEPCVTGAARRGWGAPRFLGFARHLLSEEGRHGARAGARLEDAPVFNSGQAPTEAFRGRPRFWGSGRRTWHWFMKKKEKGAAGILQSQNS